MTGGQQRTFELIPTTLVRSNGIQRTTSKAAKKAYQQANRGPKVSRVEQRRRDAAELELQKKEYEKERAAAKAKAAREKKAAKANEEKLARRKMGLPEPRKGVRASQPMISNFVRSNNTGKRGWETINQRETSDGTLSDAGNDDEQPPAKRVAVVEEDSEDEFGEFPSLSQSDLLEQIDSSMHSNRSNVSASGSGKHKEQAPAERRRRQASQELPTRKASQDTGMEDHEAFAEMATTQLLSEAAEAAAKSDDVEPITVSQPARPERTDCPIEASRATGPIAGDLFDLGISRESQNVPEVRPVVHIDHTKASMANARSPTRLLDGRSENVCKTSQQEIPQAVRPALQERSINMPPPRLPIVRKSIPVSKPRPKTNLQPYNTTKSVVKQSSSLPPSSTQAFLENHLDDFFPSPTQEMRELQDQVDESTHKIRIDKELDARKTIADDTFRDFFCSQDLVLSPQDLLEISTLSRPPLESPDLAKDTSFPAHSSHPTRPAHQPVMPEKSIPLQEEAVLDSARPESIAVPATLVKETPSKVNNSPDRCRSNSTDYGDVDLDFPRLFQENDSENEDIHTAIQANRLPTTPAPSRVPPIDSPNLSRNTSKDIDYGSFEAPARFFEEKEEDLLHAAIQESRDLVSEKTSMGAPLRDARFFEEKEEDLLQAAIQESRNLTAKKTSVAALAKDTGERTRGPPRFFEEKEEDLLQAAIHESKLTAAPRPPLRKDPRPTYESKLSAPQRLPGKKEPRQTRKLTRIQSTATDYGDDDFRGCSQELLALC